MGKPIKKKKEKKKGKSAAQAAPPEPRDLVRYKSRDGQQIRLTFDIVRRLLVHGKPEFVSDAEIVFYMAMCKSKGLNPFKRDCYLVKYTQNDPAACIVAIDYLRARANAQPDCAGWIGGVIVKAKDGAEVKKPGAFLSEGDTLLGAWFKAQKKGWSIAREWTVQLEPYIRRTREGEITRFWKPERQAEMICKVAESQGLRRVWPDELAKLYIDEEIVPEYTKEGSDADALPMPAAIEPDPGKSADSGSPTSVEASTEPGKPAPHKPAEPQKTQKTERKPAKADGNSIEKEVRDMIAAVITADDVKSSAISIDKKVAGVKDRNVLLALCKEWNNKKQSIARGQK